MTILFWFGKGHKVVSRCIVFNLTTKPTLTFWAGDQIKAKLIELRFRCHMHSYKYGSICDTGTYSKHMREKLNHIILLYKLLLKKIDQIFGFWVSHSLKLNRNSFCHGFKSCSVVNCHLCEPEKLTHSKMWTSISSISKHGHLRTIF